MKNRVIEVQNIPVSISKKESDDYICITDIIHYGRLPARHSAPHPTRLLG